jgi:hydroxymethylbilane synthase
VPVFVLASLENNFLNIRGGIISPDGSRLLMRELRVSVQEYEQAGQKLAQEILQIGGEQMLKEIKTSYNLL